MSTRSRRLAGGGRIDRGTDLRFRVDGRDYTGHRGDTLASALLAADVIETGPSIYRGRPRGILAAGVEHLEHVLALDQQVQQRIEIDAGLGRGSRRAHRAHRAAPSPTMAGSRPARSQELEARSSRSRSRLALAGSKSAGSRIIHMPIGSTR